MEEKSILITGCSSGIGHCAAMLLKKRGFRVFASSRKPTDVAKLRSQGLESVQLDVNDSASIKQAIENILQLTGGTLYALFNNSGYLQTGAIQDLTRDMLRAQFETNVFGPMEIIREILPIMRKQGEGRIIQNSSILGITTLPFCGAYNGSKFALEGLSNTLRQELRNTGIHVSIICPGPISSQLRDNAYEHYQETLKDHEGSAYGKVYDLLEQVYFDQKKRDTLFTQAPTAVVKKVIHALESSRPKAHYYVGFPAKLFAWLRRTLPDSAMDWIIANIRS